MGVMIAGDAARRERLSLAPAIISA